MTTVDDAIDARGLPHNLDAERALLGAALLHGDLLADVAARVQATDFWRAAHGKIFQTMLTLQARKTAVDFITVRDALCDAGELEDCGGPAYITALVDGVPR